jgi:hypothetical protein
VACGRHIAFGVGPSSSGFTPAGQRFTADT